MSQFRCCTNFLGSKDAIPGENGHSARFSTGHDHRVERGDFPARNEWSHLGTRPARLHLSFRAIGPPWQTDTSIHGQCAARHVFRIIAEDKRD